MPIGSGAFPPRAGTPKMWQAASLPCSADAEARLGKPTTSPFEPSAANIEANSTPITSAPTITIVAGSFASRRTMSSESRIVLP